MTIVKFCLKNIRFLKGIFSLSVSFLIFLALFFDLFSAGFCFWFFFFCTGRRKFFPILFRSRFFSDRVLMQCCFTFRLREIVFLLMRYSVLILSARRLLVFIKFVFYTVGMHAVVIFHNTALFIFILSFICVRILIRGGDKSILSALRKQYLIHK